MRISMTFCIVAMTIGIGLGSSARGDSLQLHDGRHFDGQYVGGTESVVAFLTLGSVQYFPVADVTLVAFGNGTGRTVNPLGLEGSRLAPMSQKSALPWRSRSAAPPGRSVVRKPRLSKAKAEL
jgi:hypothetical protein